uniref:Ovule protein n=1 Tax=Schistosoma curassoni TaxID=6186 RepID=A0A183KXD3_9TREM
MKHLDLTFYFLIYEIHYYPYCQDYLMEFVHFVMSSSVVELLNAVQLYPNHVCSLSLLFVCVDKIHDCYYLSNDY